MASWKEAVQAIRLDSNSYKIHLHESFCIGSVPNGGYSMSCMMEAARDYLTSRNQPHALTAHGEFPTRAETGDAIVTIEQVKLGKSLSTLHLTLWQGGLRTEAPWFSESSKRCVLIYVNQMDLATYSGTSVHGGYATLPEAQLPQPMPDFASLLSKHGDSFWIESRTPALPTLKSVHRWRFFVPRNGVISPGSMDAWMCFSSDDKFTQSTLPYVVDSYPHDVFGYFEASEAFDVQAKQATEKMPNVWSPTVALNLEVKKLLPEEGLDWLHVRATCRQMRDGRFDLDAAVRDQKGDLVILGSQTSLLLTMDRNLANRPKLS